MRRFSLVVMVAAAALFACEPAPPEGPQGVDGFGDQDASTSDAALAADGAVPLDPEPIAFGVVSTDYTVSSIGLLDADGEVLTESFIDSGSATTGLVTALSGDVALPTRSGERAIFVILDRFRTDVLTRIDPETGEVLGQLKTHAPNDGTASAAYSSNPQDYVYFDEHTAWVTRYEPNLNVPADDPDRGLDLLRVDPTDFERGERIDFWPLNSSAERRNPDTGEMQRVTTYARPSAMVRLGDRLVVGISSMSETFDAVSEGLVALVDPDARSVEPFEVPGLANCGAVSPIPDDAARVLVSCSGFYRGVQRELAGLALLVLGDDGALEVEHIWRGREHPDQPLAVGTVVPLGGTRVFAVAFGKDPAAAKEADGFVEDHDVAYVIDLESGEQRKLFEVDGRFKIGGGAFNPRTGLLLVPDASTDSQQRPTAGVRTFRVAVDGEVEPLDVLKLHAILPARQVRAL